MDVVSRIVDVSSTALLQSPLLAAHTALGARMVPFAGWNMPVQYAGINAEHLAVRSGCGIFDISHMGEFFVSGPDAAAWLNGLLTNDIATLAPGQGHYTLLLNESGGVIDDLIAYRLGPDEFFLVVNAARRDEDRAWLEARIGTAAVEFRDDSDAWAAMAVQGPAAPDIFAAATGGAAVLPPRNGVSRLALAGEDVIICRTGYTGEDGFEFFCPAAAGTAWWERFTAAGAVPCGLGARDTLRLEMGYPLNGNDLAPDRSPLEAGLGFFVAMEKGEFVGRATLAAQKAAGLPLRLVAIRMAPGAPPPRPSYPVLSGGAIVGTLASGGASPSLGCGIAMAYLPPGLAAPGTPLTIDIRGRQWPAEVVKKPFYRRPPSA